MTVELRLDRAKRSEFGSAISMICVARKEIFFLIFCLAGRSMQRHRVFWSRDAGESAQGLNWRKS